MNSQQVVPERRPRTQVVPEHRPHIELTDIAGLIGMALLILALIGAMFALNWQTWGKPAAIIVGVIVAIPIGWWGYVRVHERILHVRDRHHDHKTKEHYRAMTTRALELGHSIELEHTDFHGNTYRMRSISPLTIPGSPVTIKEMNFGGEPALLPAPLPTAPPFRNLISHIRPGHLFLGQGATSPIWGDITDLLSTLDVGRPGTGKSTLLRDVCGQVLLIGGKPIIFDPHGSILDDLGSSFECAESPRDIVEYASMLDIHLTERLASRRGGHAHFKPVLLLVDEMPIISEMAPQALPTIRRVVLEGRKVGMYALISGQGVPASILGGTLVRDAMASRYVFCTSPQQARMAGLENETAKSMMAILEEAGPGKAVLATSNRKPEIVAIPDTTTDDIRYIIERNVPDRRNVFEDIRNTQEQPMEPLYPDNPAVPEKETDTLKTLPAQEREQIIRLAKAGIPRREMCMVLGKGKHYYDSVKQVLDEEGL
jgi:hypothetical protein